jgi:hypothetical protein
MSDFDAFVESIKKMHLGGNTSEEEEIAAQISQSLRKQWDNPPTKEIEIILQRNLVDAQVRRMLFFPG